MDGAAGEEGQEEVVTSTMETGWADDGATAAATAAAAAAAACRFDDLKVRILWPPRYSSTDDTLLWHLMVI